MKKIILITFLSTILNACAFNLEQEAYDFDNFKGTPLEELALAVRNDDSKAIDDILKTQKLPVDYKESYYEQTLLALAIQNKKKIAIVALLKHGANPNELIGDPKDATPFIYAIENVENCDLFYVESLLKYGADPNLEIKNPKPGYYFAHSIPLLVAIGNRKDNGNECVDLIRLLVDKGANINYCPENSLTDICEGVIYQSLISNSMVTLRYFVIDKKIKIPKIAFIKGGYNKDSQEKYTLAAILNSEDYTFTRPDLSEIKKAKEDVLKYLKDSGQE